MYIYLETKYKTSQPSSFITSDIKTCVSKETVTRNTYMHICICIFSFIHETEGRNLFSQIIKCKLWMTINSVVTVDFSIQHILLLLFFIHTYLYIFIYTWFLMSYATTFKKFTSEMKTITCSPALFFFSWLQN